MQKAKELERRDRASQKKSPTQAAESCRKTPRPPRSVWHSEGASKEAAAIPDPTGANSALTGVYINGQELLALLDTECEVDSEEPAWRCNLPVHSWAQSLQLRFADERQHTTIGKA